MSDYYERNDIFGDYLDWGRPFEPTPGLVLEWEMVRVGVWFLEPVVSLFYVL